MTAPSDPDLYERFLAAMRTYGEHPVTLEIEVHTAVALAGLVQLALRHPDLRECPTAEVGRTFVVQVREGLEGLDPVFGDVLRAGFDPTRDLSRELPS